MPCLTGIGFSAPKRECDSRGLTAYLVLTHDDYIYFFGEDRYQPRAIIPAQGMPIVVTFTGEEDEVRASLGVEDIRIFGSVGQQIKDVVQVMRQMAGGRERLNGWRADVVFDTRLPIESVSKSQSAS